MRRAQEHSQVLRRSSQVGMYRAEVKKSAFTAPLRWLGRNSKIVFSLRCAIRAAQTAFTGRDVARVHTRIEQHSSRTKFCRGSFNFAFTPMEE